jgi:PAS domain S-box-containing protein
MSIASTSRPDDDPVRSQLADLLQLLGAVDEVLWLRDLGEERIVCVSPGFARLWGRPGEELLANPRVWIETIHPEDRERVLSAAVGVAREGPDRMEYRIVRPDGSVRLVRDRSYPVRDDRGRVVRLAGVVEDVSDRPPG